MASGLSLEESLAHLKERGASPIETIKAIREALGISLGDAKEVFSASVAWAQTVSINDSFHDDLLGMLAKD